MALKKVFRIVFVWIPVGFIALSLVLVFLLKWVPIVYTPLMLRRSVEYIGDNKYHKQQKWTALSDISINAARAVITTEDTEFFRHKGFAWEELKKMRQEHKQYGKPLRGCSTISQQTAKNVFTWGSHTFVRKAAEAYWTVLIEAIWGKKRILEVYLNVAEMGKGIYGIAAAAEKYYGLASPAKLSATQAASIAVCLPNPLRRSPSWAMKYNYGRVSRVSVRMSNADVRPLLSKPTPRKVAH